MLIGQRDTTLIYTTANYYCRKGVNKSREIISQYTMLHDPATKTRLFFLIYLFSQLLKLN